MFYEFSQSLADQILPCNLSRKWIVGLQKRYIILNVVGSLYSLCMHCLNCYKLQLNVIVSDDNSYTMYTLSDLQK